MTTTAPPPGRPRSTEVTEGPTRAPARSMLRAVGFTDDDFQRAQVGVASSWNGSPPATSTSTGWP
jgi:dihydroxy-acid dehydratase